MGVYKYYKPPGLNWSILFTEKKLNFKNTSQILFVQLSNVCQNLKVIIVLAPYHARHKGGPWPIFVI